MSDPLFAVLPAQRFAVRFVKKLIENSPYSGWVVSSQDERESQRIRVYRIGGTGIESSVSPVDDAVFAFQCVSSSPDEAEECAYWLSRATITSGDLEPRVLSATPEGPPVEELLEDENVTAFGFASRLVIRLAVEQTGNEPHA